jgi:hypothetical protein
VTLRVVRVKSQCDGEEIVEIRAGDVIWCPPGHKHWHGAAPTTAMTHIAVQESLNGKNVEWLEKGHRWRICEGRTSARLKNAARLPPAKLSYMQLLARSALLVTALSGATTPAQTTSSDHK